jgi:hypothetical protein
MSCVPKPEEVTRGPLALAVRAASEESGVPSRLLLAIGWVETRWTPPAEIRTAADEHGDATLGMMGVRAAALADAAAEMGIDAETAARDPRSNVRVAARILSDLAHEVAGHTPKRIADWHPIVARYRSDDPLAGASYADHVFEVMERGASAVVGREAIDLVPSGKLFGRTKSALAGDVDHPGARWVPAKWDHFHYGRSSPITNIIIHTTEGSYDGAISWFRSPNNPWQTSAHYVVRSSDGEVTQMVRESDTAYHIGDWNPRSIGIEHEARAGEGYLWFTDAMLRSSAAITRRACLTYIPMDRDHIRGHVEVPGASHWDPGPHFPWDLYMELVHDPNTTVVVPPIADPCGGLDYLGECAGATLRWCEGRAIREVDCARSGQACGWQSAAVGNNCVAAAPPPPAPQVSECDRLGYAGECAGLLLRWCEGGAIRERDCAALGKGCGWQDDAVGFNCLASPPPPPPEALPPSPPAVSECDRLGYAGECSGAMLRWCEGGGLRERDCAALGKACLWQDDAIGFNCLYTCESLGYAGTCDGDVLRWCEGGGLREQSCGNLGRGCGWQSDAIGFQLHMTRDRRRAAAYTGHGAFRVFGADPSRHVRRGSCRLVEGRAHRGGGRRFASGRGMRRRADWARCPRGRLESARGRGPCALRRAFGETAPRCGDSAARSDRGDARGAHSDPEIARMVGAAAGRASRRVRGAVPPHRRQPGVPAEDRAAPLSLARSR